MSQTREPGQSIQPANGHLAQLASDVLAMAKKHGATEADVVVADGENLSVQIRLGSVDRLSKAREKRLGLRIFVGKRSATSSTSDFSSESLRRLVSETCTLAKAVVEDPVSGLPGADQLATDQPDLDLHDETRLDTDRQIPGGFERRDFRRRLRPHRLPSRHAAWPSRARLRPVAPDARLPAGLIDQILAFGSW